MATIYRFVIEQKAKAGGDGRKTSDSTGKGAGKKGRSVSLFGGSKGGVEHNRKLRAINPLLNRMTGGWWEKGMRLTRAGMGLIKVNKKTGNLGLSFPAIAIILAFILQTMMKNLEEQQHKASKQNSQNFKQLENSIGAVHGQYKVSVNVMTGLQTYNQNK